MSNEFFISAWKVIDLYGCTIFLYRVINVCLNKNKFGIQSIYFTMVGGSFSRRFPIGSFHKSKKFPSCLFSNLKFIWNFKMERILLMWIIGIILFVSECSVNEWNSNRGTLDFYSWMLNWSMKWYHSAWHWVIPVLVLCSTSTHWNSSF